MVLILSLPAFRQGFVAKYSDPEAMSLPLKDHCTEGQCSKFIPIVTFSLEFGLTTISVPKYESLTAKELVSISGKNLGITGNQQKIMILYHWERKVTYVHLLPPVSMTLHLYALFQ